MLDILYFIRILFDVLTMLILLRVIASWYLPRSTNILIILLHRVTEPILAPLRRIIPRDGPLDLSPLAAIVLIEAIYYLFYYLLP